VKCNSGARLHSFPIACSSRAVRNSPRQLAKNRQCAHRDSAELGILDYDRQLVSYHLITDVLPTNRPMCSVARESMRKEALVLEVHGGAPGDDHAEGKNEEQPGGLLHGDDLADVVARQIADGE